MSGIRSLADELRESIKSDKSTEGTKKDLERQVDKKTGTRQKKPDTSLDALLTALQDFELTGREKLLIRLDERTIFLMKQLKVAKGIDMNRLIGFCLHDFFGRNPKLIQYIKDNIKTIEL